MALLKESFVRESEGQADPALHEDRSLPDILRGYRFSVCQNAAEVERALDVRRQVYVRDGGFQLPVPDVYDRRSWLLIAEDVVTGLTVGTMRVTPRSAGSLEAEKFFNVPRGLLSPQTCELSRFAILPSYRKGKTFLPVVTLGLFKLVIHFMKDVAGVHQVLICSKPERVWTFEWVAYRRTGLAAPYGSLGNAIHELMTYDFRPGFERHADHPFFEFFFTSRHAEIELPAQLPALGLHDQVAA
jgi:hypothetical protein